MKKIKERDNYVPGFRKTIRIMKMTTLLSVFVACSISASSYSQNYKVSLSKQNCSIIEVLREIEKSSEFTFFFNDNQVNVNKQTSVNVKNASLEEVLEQVLRNTNYKYQIIDRQVLIKTKEAEAVTMSSQQKRIVTGTVKDAMGEAVIGANVMVKGTTTGTVTDLDGNFSIEIPAGAVLLVSYIGYMEQEVAVKGNQPVTIALREDTQKLDEVVVVGYGTQKKVTLTGAVSAIKSDDIVTTKNENAQNMLTGKVPGVRVVQKSSEPGSFNNSFDIRGMGNPLIIIDGVPRDNMSRLDANDIESLSVLKDASAAIYGVRAANGVVLITTKKGKEGSLELSYDGNVGWQNPTGSPRSASAADWMTLKNEKAMHRLEGGILPYSQEEIDAYRRGDKVGTDWWDACMRTLAPQTQHTLSATGGNEKTNFYISTGYLYQESFLKSKSLDYNRFNVRSNVTSKLTNRLTVSLNMSGIMDEKSQPYENSDWIIRAFQRAPATQPIYANNNPEYLQNGWIEGDNPVAMMDANQVGYKKYNNKWFQTSAEATYDVPYIEGLKARAMFSYDYQIADNKLYQKTYNQYTYDEASDTYQKHGRVGTSKFRREHYTKEALLYQVALNYSRLFNEKHNVNGLLLLEGSQRNGDNFFAQRELSLALDQLFAGNSDNQEGNMSTNYDVDDPSKRDLYKEANLGLVGKFGYDYESKYLAEFSFRYDGSSKFGTGAQWGFFPSASVGWRISEEAFWKDSKLSFVNNAKLRASYGKMGDDRASNYQFVNGYLYPGGGFDGQGGAGTVFDGTFVSGVQSKGITNPYITWYISKTLNIGADVEMWNGLLGVSADYFTRDRTGLLAKRDLSLPGVVGAELPQENLNGDFTHGVEMELTHRNRVGEVNYNLKGIFSYTRTQTTYQERGRAGNSYENWRNNGNDRYNDIKWGKGDGGRYTSYDYILNSPIYADKNVLPGDYIYLDWDGDGQITDHDTHPIGYTGKPMINFSFAAGAEYKGFDLNLLFQGAGMSYVRYIEQLREPMWGNDYSNALEYFMDRWHPVDPTANPYAPSTIWVPGKFGYTGTVADENSRFNFYNASYLRLKSAEIGYTLPQQWVSKAGIKSVRIYLNGYNLFTIKGVEIDPEHPEDSYGNMYPLNRTFSVGANVKF
ncbi:TonB-linked outer membrane protein, SusC/RagA family [Parabacteroides chinchillae]|uniref:TonB-linked outer membrane protein, SusC/RagA family n=2 Tax=Parabacteroides chinchillae TaxID=871327 RepID=A0A8G2BTJ9_9BACT|nr:TonB-linked outer membrane protein, SusC/RagA family [Parabacteroides chinchillae]